MRVRERREIRNAISGVVDSRWYAGAPEARKKSITLPTIVDQG